MNTHMIIGLRPSYGTHKTITGSSTTRRLDGLMTDWRTWFYTRNVYENSVPSDLDERPQDIVDWLDKYSVDVVVTLGQEVAQIISPTVAKSPWLSLCQVRLNFAVRQTWVVKFPHPSGRNRWYNDPKNVSEASRTLWIASRLGRD